MIHPLEKEFELSAAELLDAINRRFRAKVTLEGAVAEVHLGKHIKKLHDQGIIARFEEHDIDSYPDYTIWLPDKPEKEYRIECKNVRDTEEAYRKKGQIVAFKVEAQKTRASKGDLSSRHYGFGQFDILAVCLGKKTHNWRQFMYVQTKNMASHGKYPDKLAVMHPVPLPDLPASRPWYNSLESLIGELT
jgi:hypothetical protein